MALTTPAEVLRWWRSEVLGLPQQMVADLLAVQPTALSNWENGTRAITLEPDQLDQRLKGGGALAGLLRTCTTPDGLDPRHRWSGVYPGPSTPIWMWVRSPSPVVRFEAEWGVVRVEPTLELGENGVFLVVGASVEVSPIVIHLDRPGWVDFGRGDLPEQIPGASVIPAVNLIRRSSATGAFMQLFVGALSDRFGRDRQRSRELAALAMSAPRTVASLLSGLGRPGDTESPGAWPPLVGDEEREDDDRSAFARLRDARGLSLADVAQRLEAETGIGIGKDTLRRFEAGVGRPHHDLLPAALDHVLGANGHLCRLTLRTGRGPGTVRFPSFWTGPVWLAFEADDDAEHRIDLQWGDWRRALRTRPPLLTSFICTLPRSPLRVLVDEGLSWRIGLGRRPGAAAIDQNWVPSSIAAAQDALRNAERALLNAIRASRPPSGLDG